MISRKPYVALICNNEVLIIEAARLPRISAAGKMDSLKSQADVARDACISGDDANHDCCCKRSESP